jgi:hypothetical protein
MYTLADAAGWYFLAPLFGAVAAVGFLFIIVLIEALVLRGLKWGSLKLSFVDSAVINLTSATAGVLLFAFSARLVNQGTAFLLLVFGALTVLIEGGMLTLLQRHPLRQTWTAAIAINAVSYAFLFVVLVGVLRM